MKRALFTVLTIGVVVLALRVYAQETGKMTASDSAAVQNPVQVMNEAVPAVPAAVENANPGEVMNQVIEPVTGLPSENMQENMATDESNDVMNEVEPVGGEGVMVPEGADRPGDMMMKHEEGGMEHMGTEGK